MALDYERLNGLTERQFLTQLLEGQQTIMAKQDQITQELADVKANLAAISASEAKAQTDLTAIKEAVLSTVPQLKADLKTAQDANAAQAALIDTFNADDVLTETALAELKANSDAAKSAMAGIETTTTEVLDAVKPPAVEPPV